MGKGKILIPGNWCQEALAQLDLPIIDHLCPTIALVIILWANMAYIFGRKNCKIACDNSVACVRCAAGAVGWKNGTHRRLNEWHYKFPSNAKQTPTLGLHIIFTPIWAPLSDPRSAGVLVESAFLLSHVPVCVCVS